MFYSLTAKHLEFLQNYNAKLLCKNIEAAVTLPKLALQLAGMNSAQIAYRLPTLTECAKLSISCLLEMFSIRSLTPLSKSIKLITQYPSICNKHTK